jgi:hypothetical protein
MWWIDSVRAQKLDAAMKDQSTTLDIPPVEDHYWQEYTKVHGAQVESHAATSK